MINKIVKLIIGDLDEKREYKQMQKKANALPKEYKFAFKRITKYINTVGVPGEKVDIDRNMMMLTGIVELFETAAAEGRTVIDVIGNDPATFCDELMCAYGTDTETFGDKLNKEILDRFHEKRE